jgi:hypothetical protein
MKTKQIVVLTVALVVVVGIVTYTRLNIPVGPNKGPSEPTLSKARLDFPVQVWPVPKDEMSMGSEGEPPPDMEWRVEGHHDFWFENREQQAIPVGLMRMNCKCSRVEIALAPEGWQPAPPPAAAAGQVALGPAGAMSVVAQAANEAPPLEPAAPPDVSWHPLEQFVEKGDSKGVTVPPGGRGWVRIAWNSDKVGVERIAADLWMQSPQSGSADVRLEVTLNFVEPIQVFPHDKARLVDTLNPGDRPRETTFTVYSTTRPRFDLAVEADDVQQTKHPFVRCGKPVPLTAEESRLLRETEGIRALSGYTVPVTVAERLEDGRQQDMGPFQAVVELTSPVSEQPIHLFVRGAIRGEVTVVSGPDPLKDRDRIRFETFSARLGASKTVTIEGDPRIDITIEQVPAFLKLNLQENKATAPDRKTWTLTVNIPPKAVLGAFPRPDDEALRDTAIYLKAQGQGSRRIRIPVSGTASY